MAYKRLLLFGIALAVLLLAACGYIVVEQRDTPPESITGMIRNVFGVAYAEEASADGEFAGASRSLTALIGPGAASPTAQQDAATPAVGPGAAALTTQQDAATPAAGPDAAALAAEQDAATAPAAQPDATIAGASADQTPDASPVRETATGMLTAEPAPTDTKDPNATFTSEPTPENTPSETPGPAPDDTKKPNATPGPAPDDTKRPNATPEPAPEKTKRPSETSPAPDGTKKPNASTEPEPDATLAPDETPSPDGTPSPASFPLTNGQSGDEVKALQARLRELGFMTSSADGCFGPLTGQAVEALLQYQSGLAGDGVVAANGAASPAGPGDGTPAPTSDIPKVAAAVPTDGAASPSPDGTDGEIADAAVDEALYTYILHGFQVYRSDAAMGARGNEVLRIQTRLNALDYLYAGMDGQYGLKTAAAVKAFQRLNGLRETGVSDEATQRALFSEGARASDRPPLPYLLTVDVERQRVYAYAWSVEDGAYTAQVRAMICSTGLPRSPTPLGTYVLSGPLARWGYFPDSGLYAQYLTRITGTVLFHSTFYRAVDENAPLTGSVNRLGLPATDGDVRLTAEDANWIYKNCPYGTTVIVSDDPEP